MGDFPFFLPLPKPRPVLAGLFFSHCTLLWHRQPLFSADFLDLFATVSSDLSQLFLNSFAARVTL